MWGFGSGESDKMHGEKALRMVECLRGRLQAERAASRAAEHNAELLSLKLRELEKQLKIEIKSRRKAEKKLNFLKKKLESLNIPFEIINSDESERSISSSNSETSCMSSIGFHHHQEDRLPEFHTSTSSSISSEMVEVTESKISMEEHKSQDIKKCEGSLIKSSARQESGEICHGFGLQQLTLGKDINQDESCHADNSMALVPMNLSKGLNNNFSNVGEVLETLKHIRENLRSSVEESRIITVGYSVSQ